MNKTMIPEEILKALDEWGANDLAAAPVFRAAAALIRQLQTENVELTGELQVARILADEETIHDRDARAVIVACALDTGDCLTDAQIEDLVSDGFRVADAMAAERARRAKGDE